MQCLLKDFYDYRLPLALPFDINSQMSCTAQALRKELGYHLQIMQCSESFP